MKASLLVGTIAAVVGLGGAYLVLADDGDDAVTGGEKSPGPGQTKTGAAPTNVQPDDRSDWAAEDRLDELEKEVVELRAQIRGLQLRGGVARGFAGSAGAGTPSTDEPEFQETVREIVADERDREREEQMDRRRERSRERTQETLEEFVAKANINAQQREQIGTLWNDERDQMFSMFTEARSGDRDFREVRDEARQLRRNTDEQAKTVLSEDQFEVYSELRPRGPGGGGGRPGGGRPGGGRPGGGRPGG